jgi:hypothetical protein
MTAIFEEEYDPLRIKKLCQAKESRQNFDMSAENLDITTGAPVRVFEALTAFANS